MKWSGMRSSSGGHNCQTQLVDGSYNEDSHNLAMYVTCAPQRPEIDDASAHTDGLKAGDYVLPEDLQGQFSSTTLVTPGGPRHNAQSPPLNYQQPPTTALLTPSNTYAAYSHWVYTCNPSDITFHGETCGYNRRCCQTQSSCRDFQKVKGCVRMQWSKGSAKSVSVLAQQTAGGSLEKWESGVKYGGSDYGMYTLEEGKKSPEEMIKSAKAANDALVWVLRFLGFLLMWMGSQMVFGPLSTFAEIIPCVGDCIGDLIGAVLCYATCLTSSCISLLVIAISWLVFRPVVGGILLAVVAVLAGALVYLRSQNAKGTSLSKQDSV